MSAIASGGTPGYSYLWDDNSVSPQTTPNATNLLAGRDITTITNTMDASVSSLVTYNGGHYVSCYGALDGQALVDAWGAHEPYTYQWYGPNGFNSTNDTINNLASGSYSVTVSDTNNCTFRIM